MQPPAFLVPFAYGIFVSAVERTTILCRLNPFPATLLPPRLCHALVDNGIHAIIALAMWTAALEIAAAQNDYSSGRSPRRSLLRRPCIMVRDQHEIIVSLMCGSLLDLDHFLAAGALSLRAATSLARRPPGHALIAVPVLAAAGWAAAGPRIALLVGGSLLSHQLRDALRRGLWLWPFPKSTPALSWSGYIVGQITVAVAVGMAVAALSQPRSLCGSNEAAEDVPVEAGAVDARLGDHGGGAFGPFVV